MDENKREIATAISILTSGFNKLPEIMGEFTRQHRTHQQMFGGKILAIIQDVAAKYDSDTDKPRYFDPRNEQFGKICSEINQLMSEKRHEHWFKMPLI